VLELLIAAGIAAFPAAECDVAFERREETRLVLRLRPACPIGYASTRGAVRAILAQAGGDAASSAGISLAFGRIERYPWLSEMLARQASSSRRWDLAAGRPLAGSDNAYVAAALRGMPEFTALFGRWQILGVSVEKVLTRPAAELRLAAGAPVAPAAKLPYDAIVSVALKAQP